MSLYSTSACNLILEEDATNEDQTQAWSNFSLKFPLSLQIPLDNDLKSGIQLRTSPIIRGLVYFPYKYIVKDGEG